VLSVPEGTVEFEEGQFESVHSNRKLAFWEVALAAYNAHAFPTTEIEPGLKEGCFFDPPNFTFPAGCHICEVEVDPETGVVKIIDMAAVDDFGNLVNPMVVEGQVHGGLAQGIGQAMLERTVYDEGSGQLLTGSFMDYALPRADDLPSFKVGFICTPSPSNPLGIKGCGEAGAIGAPPALINALTDALGVANFDMPATPERVWRAIQRKARA
jgi:carbon-monoxide dehydrogenase large subunit